MYVQNFYVGNQEYVISFKRGTHQVTRIDYDQYSDTDMSEVVFTGHYDKCIDFLEGTHQEYALACMF